MLHLISLKAQLSVRPASATHPRTTTLNRSDLVLDLRGTEGTTLRSLDHPQPPCPLTSCNEQLDAHATDNASAKHAHALSHSLASS